MTQNGIGVSAGFAVGKALIYRCASSVDSTIYADSTQALTALRDVIAEAVQELQTLAASFAPQNAAQGKIFAAHCEILADEEILSLLRNAIVQDNLAPAAAVQKAFGFFIDLFSGLADPMFAARAADLLDVQQRLLRLLAGGKSFAWDSIVSPVILVTDVLLPSDAAALHPKQILGIVTQRGGATSHAAILAREAGIPAVLGVANITDLAPETLLGLDGTNGRIWIDPPADIITALSKKRSAFLDSRAQADAFLNAPARLKDGTRIAIGVNIAAQTPEAVCCDFVGLLRSEFLYLGRINLPTEDEQTEAYAAALRTFADKTVTLRTADLGGDKALPALALPQEENPFLGVRGVRLSAAQPTLFKTQLRAALRAAVHGPLQVMLPMVTCIEELRWAKALLEECRTELCAEGVPFAQHLPLGVMIEVPSAALLAQEFAREADFASIGTNDLCQYICAADRMNPAVCNCYQSYSPAVLRLIQHTASAFAAAGKPLSVCGELAGNPAAAVLLVGLGITKLSMNASAIAAVKQQLASYTLAEAQKLAADALCCATEAQVQALLQT